MGHVSKSAVILKEEKNTGLGHDALTDMLRLDADNRS
jgi:hypothetical protein